MIEICNLEVSLGKQVIFTDLNLRINRGEFVTVLGPSGCGKTTMFNCLVGFIQPDCGSVEIKNGRENGRQSRVGMIFQEYGIFPWRNVMKNLMLGFHGRQMDKEEKRQKAQELVNLLGLAGYERFYPKALSGGMKQRVAIARTLAMDPPVILMDEPFGALDNFMRERLQELVLDLWQQLHKTILFITHNVREAVFLGNRLLLMDRSGRIILDRPTPVVASRTDDALIALEKEIRPLLTYDVNE